MRKSNICQAAAEYVRAIEIDMEAEDYALPEEGTIEAADGAIDRLIEIYHTEFQLNVVSKYKINSEVFLKIKVYGGEHRQNDK